MKKIQTLIILLIFSFFSANAQLWIEKQKIVASDRDIEDAFGASVAIDGNYAVVGASWEKDNATDQDSLYRSGSAYVFEKNSNGSWSQIQKIVASDRAEWSYFGSSVSISGNHIIIGTSNWIGDSGKAYIFERESDGIWRQAQKIVPSDGEDGRRFGYPVSISGDYAIVGATYEDKDALGDNRIHQAGAAYIFEKANNGSWEEVQKIVPSDRNHQDEFGTSVSVSGNYVIVGAPRSLKAKGSTYIFERSSSGSWDEVQQIVPSDQETVFGFGQSASISGNYAIIGIYANLDPNWGNAPPGTGLAYIFERSNNGTWSEVQRLKASDNRLTDLFGRHVSINSNYAIVGAYQQDVDTSGTSYFKNAGAAYIFGRENNGTWSQIQKISASDRGTEDHFGSSVFISGNDAIVGAWKEDENVLGMDSLDHAGSAYIFSLENIEYKPQPINIAPNPTTEYLSIDLRPVSNQKIKIEIFDSSGQRVLFQEDVYDRETTLDLTTFVSGAYYLLITGKAGHFYAKFIKL